MNEQDTKQFGDVVNALTFVRLILVLKERQSNRGFNVLFVFTG